MALAVIAATAGERTVTGTPTVSAIFMDWRALGATTVDTAVNHYRCIIIVIPTSLFVTGEGRGERGWGREGEGERENINSIFCFIILIHVSNSNSNRGLFLVDEKDK